MSQPPYGPPGPPQQPGQPQWQPNGYGYPQPAPMYQQPPTPMHQPQIMMPMGPQRAVTRPKTSVFDIIMLIFTCGMWWPVIAAKKRRHTTVTKYKY